MPVESAEQSDKLKQSLKEEKQTRKRLESKVDHIEEELNDVKHEKESLERVRDGSVYSCPVIWVYSRNNVSYTIEIDETSVFRNTILQRAGCQGVILRTHCVFSESWRTKKETCGREEEV